MPYRNNSIPSFECCEKVPYCGACCNLPCGCPVKAMKQVEKEITEANKRRKNILTIVENWKFKSHE